MVSVIVPVYNVAPWLDECLDSIESQELPPGEVILVDDGSTDGSGEICDRRAAASPLYRVVHTANGGLSAARNRGIEMARGSHVVFVDSDDTIAPDFLRRLVDVAGLTGADIVCSPLSEGGDGGAPPRVYDPEEALRLVLLQRRGMQCSACGKLFSIRLFDSERFREGILYEDLDIIGRLMSHASKVASIKRGGYRYRTREGSITHDFNRRRLDVLDITGRIEAFCASRFPRLLPAARERTFSAACNMLILLRRASLGHTPDADRCRSLICERASGSLFGRGVRLKSRIGAAFAMAFVSNPVRRKGPQRKR